MPAPGCGTQPLDVGSSGAGNHGASSGSAGANDDGTPTSWFPASNCVPAGPSPKLLVELDAHETISSLAIDGTTLYFDSYDSRSQGITMRLYSVPIAGGAVTPHAIEGYRSLAGVHQGRVVYVRTTHAGDGSKLDPRHEQVVLLDVVTGATTEMQNPGTNTYVSGVRVHASGIFWLSRMHDAQVPASLSRWVGGVATELATLQNFTWMVTDGLDLFYLRYDAQATPTSEMRLESVPIAGGFPRVIRRWPHDGKWRFSVAAVDDRDVYFTQEATDDTGAVGAGDLRAVQKDGVGERVVTSGASFGTDSMQIDPDFVTWIDRDAPWTIVRVRRAGGSVERLPNTPNHSVNALTVDSCNLYYAATNPPAIYARSRVVP